MGEVSSFFTESCSVNALFGFRTANHEKHFRDGFGFHFLAGYFWSEQQETGFSFRRAKVWRSDATFGAGFEARLTKHVKFIADYQNMMPFNLNGNSEEFDGMANFGLRIHGSQLSADIAAIRPLTTDDLGELVVLPLLTIAYRIGD